MNQLILCACLGLWSAATALVAFKAGYECGWRNGFNAGVHRAKVFSRWKTREQSSRFDRVRL